MKKFRSDFTIVASALRADLESALFFALQGGATPPGEPSSVAAGADRGLNLLPMVSSGFIGDVVTCDVMFSKVSQRPVFTTAVCTVGALSLLYIIFLKGSNNVTTSPPNVYRGFVGDVMVTLSLFVPFCVSRDHPPICVDLISSVVFPNPELRTLNFELNPKD